MSILHRISGVGLVKLMMCAIFFLYTLVAGEEYYNIFCAFLSHPIIKLSILLAIACVYYHLLNGIRYLIWGMGEELEIKSVYLSGWIISVTVIILTIITWMII